MSSNTKRPFYLEGRGENRISPTHVDAFLERAPELTDAIIQYPPELKTLDIQPFQSFCYWVLSQQISSHVANQLIDRFSQSMNPLTPDVVLQTPLETLRSLGISRSKAGYLHNVAQFFGEELAPQSYPELSSEALVQYYTQIKGVGEWTAQMHLIFCEGRLDIFPVKDLVVRQGIAVLYGLESTPTESQAKDCCEHWGELATIGATLAWACTQ